MYRGQLIDGPDIGNFIDSTVPMVSCIFTSELRVDGKPTDIVVTKGSYNWDTKDLCFKWKLLGSKIYTQSEYTIYIANKGLLQ